MTTPNIHGLRAAIYDRLGWVYHAKSTPPPILTLMMACGMVRSPSGLFECNGWLRGRTPDDLGFSIVEVQARPGHIVTGIEPSLEPLQVSDFHGVVISLDHYIPFLGRTLITTDRGQLNPQQIQDMQRVGMVSSEFERLFEVFGDDQVETRALLTPDFIERLTQFRQGEARQNIDSHVSQDMQFVFLGNQFHIALNCKDHIRFGHDVQSDDIHKAALTVLNDVSVIFWVLESVQALQARLSRHGFAAQDDARRQAYQIRMKALEAAVQDAITKDVLMEFGNRQNPHHTDHAYMVSEPLRGLLTPRF